MKDMKCVSRQLDSKPAVAVSKIKSNNMCTWYVVLKSCPSREECRWGRRVHKMGVVQTLVRSAETPARRIALGGDHS